jgi:hypothetical protein
MLGGRFLGGLAGEAALAAVAGEDFAAVEAAVGDILTLK